MVRHVIVLSMFYIYHMVVPSMVYSIYINIISKCNIKVQSSYGESIRKVMVSLVRKRKVSPRVMVYNNEQ